jgi:c-di-GMP-binding flagellar brake protein YcgR
MAGDERRKQPRIDIVLPVECIFPEERANILYTVCKNISLGGVQIIVQNSLSYGKNLGLRIDLIDKSVRAKAEVIWCRRELHSDRYNVGLKFLEFKNKSKTHIDQLINKIYHSIEVWAKKMKKNRSGDA